MDFIILISTSVGFYLCGWNLNESKEKKENESSSKQTIEDYKEQQEGFDAMIKQKKEENSWFHFTENFKRRSNIDSNLSKQLSHFGKSNIFSLGHPVFSHRVSYHQSSERLPKANSTFLAPP